MYDILAGTEGGNIGAYMMGKTKTIDSFPMLKQDGLVGGVVYYDGPSDPFRAACRQRDLSLTPMAPPGLPPFPGQHNDARMNMALILSAVHQGATVANYVSVIALNKDANGKLNGARLRDEMTGEEWNVKAKVRRVPLLPAEDVADPALSVSRASSTRPDRSATASVRWTTPPSPTLSPRRPASTSRCPPSWVPSRWACSTLCVWPDGLAHPLRRLR